MEEIDQYVLPQPGTAAATAETQQHHDLYPFNAGFLQLDCSLNYSHTSDSILDPHQQQQQQQLQHASAAIYAAQNSSDSTISQSCNSNLKLDPRLSLNNHSNSNSPPASMAGGGGAAAAGGEGGSSTYLQGGAVAAGGSEQGMNAMREMIFRVAAMQPIHIDPESIKRPKRRNVKISKDPQSVAARHRREKISERIRILQRLVPGGTKMDTASMLDEAIHYVKFLKKQVQALEAAAAASAKSWPTFSQQQPHHHHSQIGLTYIPISPFSTSAAPVMTPAPAAMNCTLQFASLPCGTGFTETGLM